MTIFDVVLLPTLHTINRPLTGLATDLFELSDEK